MTAQEIGLLLIDASIAIFLACLFIVCAVFVVTYCLEKYIDIRERIEKLRKEGGDD